MRTVDSAELQKNGQSSSNELMLSEALNNLTQRFNEMERNQQTLKERTHQAESGQKNAEETLRVLREHMNHTFNHIELIATFIGGSVAGIFLMLLFRQRSPSRRTATVTPRTSSGTKSASPQTPASTPKGSPPSQPSSHSVPSTSVPSTLVPQTPLPVKGQQIPPSVPKQTPIAPKPVPPVSQTPSFTAAPLSETTKAAQTDTDPVIELANVMVSLGLAQEAARDLMTYIHQQRSRNPSHWFKALEIYRELDQRTAFDETSLDLKQTLNIAPELWDSASDAHFLNSLEDYPHLIAKLQSLWCKPECKEFLHHLLEDNREGQRSGFSKPVVEDIVLLNNVLDMRT